MKKVSIIDVAKAAGVSVSTVSLVLRQKGKISAQTIEKVQAAIAGLGYVHNVAAANLRASTSNLIGLVVCDLSDTFTLKVMTRIVQALEQQGYMALLAYTQDEEARLTQCLLAFSRQGVAGVIFLNANPRRQRLPEAMRDCPLPQVIVSQTPIDNADDLVVRGNRQAAALATRYLIGRIATARAAAGRLSSGVAAAWPAVSRGVGAGLPGGDRGRAAGQPPPAGEQ